MTSKEIVIKVPSRMTINYEDEIIRKLNCIYDYAQKLRSFFALEFIDVKEIDLLGLLILYKFLEYSVLNKCFNNPYLLNFDSNKVISNRVSYFGFSELLDELKNSKDSDKQYKNLQINVAKDFIIAPMALLKETNSSDYLNTEYAKRIESYYIDEKTNTMIFTVFSEIFLNFWAHASGDNKSIIVAHGNQNYVEIACADTGQGIIKSITEAYPNCKREKALQMALIKGVTSKKNTNHMGYGLWLINEIVEKTKGKILLQSEEYCYENNQGKTRFRQTPCWHGTIVYVKLFLSNPVTIDDIEQKNKELKTLKINFQ